MREIVFWQGILSIHQSALLRSMASSGFDVTLVVSEGLPEGRKRMGWYEPDYGAIRIVSKPNRTELQTLLLQDAVHIFSGTRGHPLVWDAFRQSVSLDKPIGIQAESQNGMDWLGMLRFLRSCMDAQRLKTRIQFILAMGRIGVNWYRNSGYPWDRIYPFAYFVEDPSPRGDGAARQVAPDSFRRDLYHLIFVGQLVCRKGWDILLRAVSNLSGTNWRLHIVGHGPHAQKLITLRDRLGLGDSVRIYGSLSNADTLNLISASDLLVLPARWDGWGAVVNEALMCGVPVVCSSACGAADLLGDRERGQVFRSGSVSELSAILQSIISEGRRDASARARIRAWSRCINGASGAVYLAAVIDHALGEGSRPVAPWLLAGNSSDTSSGTGVG